MSTHIPHPSPGERGEFLVDGCPRCQEYVNDMGIHFDPQRFREFWAHMVRVEFQDEGDSYKSTLDKELGRRLYLIALAFKRSGIVVYEVSLAQ